MIEAFANSKTLCFNPMATLKNILIIRNFKGVPQFQDNYAEKQWSLLEPEIVAILNSKKNSKSLEEIYRMVENLHKFNCTAFVLINLGTVLETDLLKKLYGLLDNEENFLSTLNELWEDFSKQMKTIRNIFILFERNPKSGQYNSVQIISSTLFKNTIVLNPTIKRRISDNLLKSIEKERGGLTIDISLMRSILRMLTYLQTYGEVFQVEFEKVSEEFYENEGNVLIKYFSISEYLKYINYRILEEATRGFNYVNSSTQESMVELVEKKLIKDHVNEILDAGFESLIVADNFDDLRLLHDLIMRLFGGYHYLSDYFVEFVSKEGTKIIKSPDNEMIEKLLLFKDKLNFVIKNCFNNNRLMFDDMRKTFLKFINNQQNRPAQLLAKYVDQKLRCKEISVDELEKCLKDVMIIFRLIQGKDIFEAFYKKDLAKRLLLGKSTSQDAESSMVSKLRYECGGIFTSKIEGMFNDINISWEINSAFKQHLNNTSNKIDNSPDLSINVLTSSFWPNYPSFNVNLPVEFANYQNIFQNFYIANHSGKKLIWQPTLGYCVLKAEFDCGKKELQVSLFQTLILLLFNGTNELTFNEIQELTNLKDAELKRTLISLSCGKSRVILKRPKGIEVEANDVFIFNNNFTDKLFRIRINQIQLKETKEEEKATEKSVLVDRQFQIDAAIVRIMKSCKFISHTNLISELFDKLGIPVKPSDLKKRIELLIEREYMERDKDNPANYNYIA